MMIGDRDGFDEKGENENGADEDNDVDGDDVVVTVWSCWWL